MNIHQCFIGDNNRDNNNNKENQMQIPRVSKNYIEYKLTPRGIEVTYDDETTELVVANNTLIKYFKDNNILLSADGVIKNNKNMSSYNAPKTDKPKAPKPKPKPKKATPKKSTAKSTTPKKSK